MFSVSPRSSYTDSEVSHAPEIFHFRRRAADEIANDAGIGKDPVFAARNQPARGNAAGNPSTRRAMPWRRKEHIARNDRHYAAGRGLNRDRALIGQQFEGAQIALGALFRSVTDRVEQRRPPQRGGAFDIGGQDPTVHAGSG